MKNDSITTLPNLWEWRLITRVFLKLGAHSYQERWRAAIGYAESSLGSLTSQECPLRQSLKHRPICPMYSPPYEKEIEEMMHFLHCTNWLPCLLGKVLGEEGMLTCRHFCTSLNLNLKNTSTSKRETSTSK